MIMEGFTDVVHRDAWERFGNLIGAYKIKYIDRCKGETYEITMPAKGRGVGPGETFVLKADGNRFDGGYVNVIFSDTRPAILD